MSINSVIQKGFLLFLCKKDILKNKNVPLNLVSSNTYGSGSFLPPSPVQVKVLLVSDKYLDYAKEVAEQLRKQGIRVEIDERDEKLGYKIREARMDRVPYMLIVGEKEKCNHTVSVRQRDAGAAGQELGEMSLDRLIELIREAVDNLR